MADVSSLSGVLLPDDPTDATEAARRSWVTAQVGPSIYDTFTGKADGAPTIADSGQTWLPSGQIAPSISGGKLGYPTGQTVPPAGATYAQVDAGAACVKIGGTLRFDNSVDTGASVALGLFTTSGVVTTGPAPTGASAHLAVTPTYFQMSLFSNVNTDYTNVTPVGFTAPAVYFPSPLGTDGVTTYPIEIVLDRAASRAYVTVGDNPTVEYQDSRISTVIGRYPFWESFPNGSATNLGGFTSIYADTKVTNAELNAARGSCRARSGAGPGSARFTSRMRPGALWWDSTTSKSTISTGDSWRDVATGAVVSNLLTPSVACATDTAANMAGSGTKARANALTLPWKNSTAYRLTATGNGAMACYPSAFTPVTGGATYTFVIDQMLALTNARSVTCQISWYTAASGSAGASTISSSTTLSTTTPTTLPVATAVAPGSATKVLVVVNIAGAATNDAFLVTRLGFFNGAVSAYLEP